MLHSLQLFYFQVLFGFCRVLFLHVCPLHSSGMLPAWLSVPTDKPEKIITVYQLRVHASASPGIEFLAVREHAVVMVPDIVTYFDGARAFFGHESLLDHDVV